MHTHPRTFVVVLASLIASTSLASTALAQSAPPSTGAALDAPADDVVVAPQAPAQAAPPPSAPAPQPGQPYPGQPYPGQPYAAQPYVGQPYYAPYGAPQYSYYDPGASRRHRAIIGYRNEQRNPPAIWGAGLGIFLAGWVLDFAILTPLANALSEDRAGADEEDAWAWSLIPIAGPFIQLGIEAPHPAIPIITGLMQIGGLVTFIYGLTQRETHRVPVREGDQAMVDVDFDAGPLEGGAQVSLRVTHF